MIAFALSILFRLPHYLSRNFFFDGDEAVIGIMAQDLLEGRSFPMYFYGQNYGFSMFETFSTAIFIKILGNGIWALRLGGLLLFSLGATFIFKTAQNRGAGWLWCSMIAMLILCFPTWYLWGGMVRGGYVTAFTLCCAIFYIIHAISFSFEKVIVAAILSALVFESHVLILIPFAPFILFWLLRNGKPLLNLICFVVPFGFAVLLIRFAGCTDAGWNNSEMVFGWKEQIENFTIQLEGMIAGYSDFFFFSAYIKIPAWWQWLLYLSLSFILVLLIWDFVRSSKFRRWYYLCFIISQATFCFLFSTISLPVPRYWIGFFTGFLFVLIFIFITRLPSRFARSGLIVLLLIFIAGAGSGSKMKDHWIDSDIHEMEAFEALHKEVLKYGAKAVFISDNLIQCQWNYLYGKEIPASGFRERERTNEFNERAIRVYNENPSQVVIAGLWGIFLGMDSMEGFNDKRYQVEIKYYVNPEAASAYIEQGRKERNK